MDNQELVAEFVTDLLSLVFFFFLPGEGRTDLLGSTGKRSEFLGDLRSEEDVDTFELLVTVVVEAHGVVVTAGPKLDLDETKPVLGANIELFTRGDFNSSEIP